ncbi:MAG: hypothetical protein FWG67_10145 [Defluviitaleaceae bacterium]|nr:hypothetical protein [Defluviitaleaceae bacterium]
MKKIIAQNFANPYLPLWEHLPDGEPRVFEDPDHPGKYRAYIIGSHDLRVDGYCGPDIRAWSAPVEDLNDWRDEGSIFTYEVDNRWDVMYAPDLVEIVRKDGKKDYYLYPHSRGESREAMVCKGPTPVGPFTPINLTEDGRSTVPGSILGFDPAVYIEYVTDPTDPDYEIGFRAYGYWGFQKSHAAELDQTTMYSLRPGTEVIHHFIPASARYGEIHDPEGTTYPSVYAGEDLKRFNFFEAASIRKVGHKYVWIYSGYSGPDYGLESTNSTLRYAYGDTLLGPWKSGGVLIDSRSVELNQDGTALETYYRPHNTHGSIEVINDQWYVFYHRPPRGFGYARQAMVAPIHVTYDEASVAEGGEVKITGWDPYLENQKWTLKAGNQVYMGAEMTSEGFNVYGLAPYRYYSAGIACFLSNPQLQEDAWDIWDDHMPLTDVSNGDIIGYKYFGFGGLNEHKKGLAPFEGTKPDHETAFNLFLVPKTTDAFKVNVWLDGPWANEAWKGKKIAEISVPTGSAHQVTKFTVDVSRFVDHLNQKKGIYLVMEGNDQPLCDLIGLGFSKRDHEIDQPVVPEVAISVNEQPLLLPKTPVRSTDKNGICDFSTYQTCVTLPTGNKEMPQITASATHADVLVNLEMPKSIDKEAIVTFDYKGVVKTYRIGFKFDE